MLENNNIIKFERKKLSQKAQKMFINLRLDIICGKGKDLNYTVENLNLAKKIWNSQTETEIISYFGEDYEKVSLEKFLNWCQFGRE